MSTIAIIPARGGSKGIPRKNLLSICGKPLIAWTIEDALAAESIDEVYVSTDNYEISATSTDCGAKVIARPEDLSGDTASSESVLRHAIDSIEAWGRYRRSLSLIVFLQATSPIRRFGDLDEAIDMMERGYDSLFSANLVHGHVWRDTDFGLAPCYDRRQRRQDQSGRFLEENGSFYVFVRDGFLRWNQRLFGPIGAYVQHPDCRHQIDSPEDVPIVEEILSKHAVSA